MCPMMRIESILFQERHSAAAPGPEDVCKHSNVPIIEEMPIVQARSAWGEGEVMFMLRGRYCTCQIVHTTILERQRDVLRDCTSVGLRSTGHKSGGILAVYSRLMRSSREVQQACDTSCFSNMNAMGAQSDCRAGGLQLCVPKPTLALQH